MSDMSSLSHEYASTADFARQINDATLLLKKIHLRRGRTAIDEERLREAITLMHEMVRLGSSVESHANGGRVRHSRRRAGAH
jgi:hypothetical protein